MKLMSGFVLGIVFGIQCGLLAGLCLMYIFQEKIFFEYSQDFVDNIVPALFTAIATFLAAVFAVSGVALNIRNQNRLEYQRTERRLRAARSALPMTLSELVRICELYLLQIRHRGMYDTSESMVMSDTSQKTIRTIIENSDETIQHELSRFLACYQIAVSRFNLFIADHQKAEYDNGIDKYEVELVVAWASLSALVACYFDYSRGAEFELDNDKALSAFKSTLWQHSYDFEGGMLKELPICDALRGYMQSDSVKGCGFLDPDRIK